MIGSTVVAFIALLGVVAVQGQNVAHNSAEGNALKQLFLATNGNSDSYWTYQTNWRLPTQNVAGAQTNVCNWIGVTCRDSPSVGVYELYLAFNQLGGTIPAAIGALTKLEKLFLNNNTITGKLPSEINQLTNLKLFHAFGNGFSGTIPSVNAMSGLEQFFLEDNDLQGQIPSSLGTRPNLEYVNLEENNLGGTLPSSFGTSSTLTDLRLSGNSISGVLPAGLVNGAVPVATLDVKGNSFFGELPANVAEAVINMDLSDNDFSCFPPFFEDRDIDLTGNRFLCGDVANSLGLTEESGNCRLPTIAEATPLIIQNTNPPEQTTITVTVDDASSIKSCGGVYCWLGETFNAAGIATINAASNTLTCKVTSGGNNGLFVLSLRTAAGVRVSKSVNSPVVIKYKVACEGDPECGGSERGACTENGCVCNSAMRYTGLACEFRLCPNDCFEDQGQGTCDTNTGECTCEVEGEPTGYRGEDCSALIPTCPTGGEPEEQCSGHGTCRTESAPARCVCDDGYGPDALLVPETNCEFLKCPTNNPINGDCSGHGTCTDGVCTCDDDWYPPESGCNLKPCPDCGEYGVCNEETGECQCLLGWASTAQTDSFGSVDEDVDCFPCRCKRCDTLMKTRTDLECSGHGTCSYTLMDDEVHYEGTCTCDDPQPSFSNPEGRGRYNEGNCGRLLYACPRNNETGEECSCTRVSDTFCLAERGACDPASGVCTCVSNSFRSFTGDACETISCVAELNNCDPDPLPGQPKGQCVDGACVCNPGFAGEDCGVLGCPPTEFGPCGSEDPEGARGECDPNLGLCVCVPGLDSKTNCLTRLCPNSNNQGDCGGNGECQTNGECSCGSGWGGDGCDRVVEDAAPIVGGVIGGVAFLAIASAATFYILRQRAIASLK
jgi:hypothetical protein